MSWKKILKYEFPNIGDSSKRWFPEGTLSKDDLIQAKKRIRFDFLPKLTGQAEKDVLQWTDLIERAIETFDDENIVSFMTPEFILAQINLILEKAGISPEDKQRRDLA